MATTKTIRKKTSKAVTVKTSTTKVATSSPAQSRRAKPHSSELKNKRLPNVIGITREAGGLLWHRKGLFGGILLIYGVINVLLVQAYVSQSQITLLQKQLSLALHGDPSAMFTYTVVAGVSTGAGAKSGGNGYQFILGIIASLAIIWALRKSAAKAPARIRDAFYKGMFPLIPFVLVLLLIAVELLPMIIGVGLYGTVVGGGIAATLIEKMFWAILALGTIALSLYLVTPGILALYIATLPDMTPVRAIRSAHQLIKNRRLAVLRKLLFLPLLIVVVTGLIMVPIISWVTPLAQVGFVAVSLFALSFGHSYLYSVYRELIDEKV